MSYADCYGRILDLIGQVAVLQYHLGAACDYADGDHVPPASAVARWRELASDHDAGCAGARDWVRLPGAVGSEATAQTRVASGTGSIPVAGNSDEVPR